MSREAGPHTVSIVIAQAPFLFSVAGLSLSLAGLAGLVAGLRRGSELRPIELFRLREIVEFSFATALVALSAVPLSEFTGDVVVTMQLLGAIGVVYVLFVLVTLDARRRRHHLGIRESPGWLAAVLGINLVAVASGVVALLTGSVGAAEVMLLALLARPMAAFLLVLGGLGQPSGPPT